MNPLLDGLKKGFDLYKKAIENCVAFSLAPITAGLIVVDIPLRWLLLTVPTGLVAMTAVTLAAPIGILGYALTDTIKSYQKKNLQSSPEAVIAPKTTSQDLTLGYELEAKSNTSKEKAMSSAPVIDSHTIILRSRCG